jgi:hypothetical protein
LFLFFILLFHVNKDYTSKFAISGPTVQVKMLHRRLKITDKMENDLTEKETNTSECIRLAPLLSDITVVKKREI